MNISFVSLWETIISHKKGEGALVSFWQLKHFAAVSLCTKMMTMDASTLQLTALSKLHNALGFYYWWWLGPTLSILLTIWKWRFFTSKVIMLDARLKSVSQTGERSLGGVDVYGWVTTTIKKCQKNVPNWEVRVNFEHFWFSRYNIRPVTIDWHSRTGIKHRRFCYMTKRGFRKRKQLIFLQERYQY